MPVALLHVAEEFVLRRQITALGGLQDLIEPLRRKTARRVAGHARAKREHVRRLLAVQRALGQRVAELVEDGHRISPS